jgi:hypothetical protein
MSASLCCGEVTESTDTARKQNSEIRFQVTLSVQAAAAELAEAQRKIEEERAKVRLAAYMRVKGGGVRGGCTRWSRHPVPS